MLIFQKKKKLLEEYRKSCKFMKCEAEIKNYWIIKINDRKAIKYSIGKSVDGTMSF